MLVLSRKKFETIKIGDDIVIMVTEIRGDKVRIGIEAPPSVSVDRSEVRAAKERCEAMKANKRSTNQS